MTAAMLGTRMSAGPPSKPPVRSALPKRSPSALPIDRDQRSEFLDEAGGNPIDRFQLVHVQEWPVRFSVFDDALRQDGTDAGERLEERRVGRVQVDQLAVWPGHRVGRCFVNVGWRRRAGGADR